MSSGAPIGGDLVQIAVAHAEPVGGFTGWRPAMPVVQWRLRNHEPLRRHRRRLPRGASGETIAALVRRHASRLWRAGGRRADVHARRKGRGARPRRSRDGSSARRFVGSDPRRARSARRRASSRRSAAAARVSACRMSPRRRRSRARARAAGCSCRARGERRHLRGGARRAAIAMTVHFIGAGPGAPDLITVRGRDLIARCPGLPLCGLAGAARAARPLPAGRAHRRHRAARSRRDRRALRRGALRPARMSRGCIRAISRSGARWASSCAGSTALGIPYTRDAGRAVLRRRGGGAEAELTLPGVAQSLVLTRTSGRASAMPERETLAAFAATGATLAIHLSIHALDRGRGGAAAASTAPIARSPSSRAPPGRTSGSCAARSATIVEAMRGQRRSSARR